jgi:hypothetical protein
LMMPIHGIFEKLCVRTCVNNGGVSPDKLVLLCCAERSSCTTCFGSWALLVQASDHVAQLATRLSCIWPCLRGWVWWTVHLLGSCSRQYCGRAV